MDGRNKVVYASSGDSMHDKYLPNKAESKTWMQRGFGNLIGGVVTFMRSKELEEAVEESIHSGKHWCHRRVSDTHIKFAL